MPNRTEDEHAVVPCWECPCHVRAAVWRLLAEGLDERDAAAVVPTPRELEVLHGVAEDRSDAQIARSMGISPHTVHAHVGALRRKLDVHTRAGAVARAFRLGLLV